MTPLTSPRHAFSGLRRGMTNGRAVGYPCPGNGAGKFPGLRPGLGSWPCPSPHFGGAVVGMISQDALHSQRGEAVDGYGVAWQAQQVVAELRRNPWAHA